MRNVLNEFPYIYLDAKRLALKLLARIKHPEVFPAIESFPEGSLMLASDTYETGKEILHRLRMLWEAEDRANADR
jgi:hypothetical protein